MSHVGRTMPRTVLFSVSIYNYHREVLPVVEEFRRAGWRVVVLLGWIGAQADAAQSAYEALGCEVVRPLPQYSYGNPDAAHVSGRHAEKPAAPPSAIGRLREFAGQFRYIGRMRGDVEALLGRISPDAIFCGPFHSCGMLDNAVMRWGREGRVPMFCYPVSAYHGEKGAVRARFQNVGHGMVKKDILADYDWINGLLATLFHAWTRSKGGVTLFMWNPVRMLAARLRGLLEEQVWQKPSTGFDVVFVFFPLSKRLLAESSYPMQKVRVTGVPLLDAAIERIDNGEHRQRLFADLGLTDGTPFLLFNVEPSAEHHYADWEDHWRRFREMMVAVRHAGLPVVLSLHPLCREQDYAFAEEEYGVRISRNYKIYDLYPFCRLSVSFVCSTNLLAEMFRKPLVIYDFFGIASEKSERADEYRLEGALVADTADGAAVLIEQALRDAQAGAGVARYARACPAMRIEVEKLLAG